MTKIEINFPLFVGAADYHEFGHLQSILEQLSGTKVKYEELDSDPDVDYSPDVATNSACYYFAVFYIGKKDAKVKKAIEQFLTGTTD